MTKAIMRALHIDGLRLAQGPWLELRVGYSVPAVGYMSGCLAGDRVVVPDGAAWKVDRKSSVSADGGEFDPLANRGTNRRGAK